MAKRNWRQKVQMQRREDRYNASLWAGVIEAKLQAALSPEAWAEIEAAWQTKDDLEAYLPEQRRDFLVAEAQRVGRLDLVPLEAF